MAPVASPWPSHASHDASCATMGFAERLRNVGLDFEAEVSKAVEVVARSARSDAQLLQEEVEWLQSQLHAERAQSDARRSACSELKKQLQEAQEQLHRQRQAAEYWQTEFNIKEEQHSLLEAKLAAMALSEAEAIEAASPGDEKSKDQAAKVADPPLETLELTGARPKKLPALDVLGHGHDEDAQLDIGIEGFHQLLLAAIQKPEGSVALNRILHRWVCCLLNHQEGLAIKSAVAMGNMEALEALISLGGTSAVSVAIAAENGQDASAPEVVNASDRSSEGGMLCSCAACGDAGSLALLLEHLHDRRGLEMVRKARRLAAQNGHSDAAQLLATHLVVELSYVGNTKYRAGEYDSAIACYQEAIDLCQEHGGPGSTGQAGVPVSTYNRDNLVRLRYNLARAFHRSDRWGEAREQATAVLELDSLYLNAYALRAQAAMASLDWAAAKDDWDKLLSGPAGLSHEVLRAWRRRKDECCRQLEQDHYEALNLPCLADTDEVRRAYRDLARRWHPDKHQSRPSDLQSRAAKRFGRIREAYEVLSNEALKVAYDSQLMQQARPFTTSRGLSSHRSVDRKDFFDHLQPAWEDHERML